MARRREETELRAGAFVFVAFLLFAGFGAVWQVIEWLIGVFGG